MNSRSSLPDRLAPRAPPVRAPARDRRCAARHAAILSRRSCSGRKRCHQEPGRRGSRPSTARGSRVPSAASRSDRTSSRPAVPDACDVGIRGPVVDSQHGRHRDGRNLLTLGDQTRIVCMLELGRRVVLELRVVFHGRNLKPSGHLPFELRQWLGRQPEGGSDLVALAHFLHRDAVRIRWPSRRFRAVER